VSSDPSCLGLVVPPHDSARSFGSSQIGLKFLGLHLLNMNILSKVCVSLLLAARIRMIEMAQTGVAFHKFCRYLSRFKIKLLDPSFSMPIYGTLG
jgi:hypothetical protein